MKKTIRKVGNSAGIIIDRDLRVLSDIALGDEVEVTASKGRIVIKKIAKAD